MEQIGGWMARDGEMRGEILVGMCRRLGTRESGRKEAYCQGGIGLLAVGEGESFHVCEDSRGRCVLLMTGETVGDAEAVMSAYHVPGDAFAKRLRGQLSFAILDEGRGELILARSQRGKPLYWSEENGVLVFSSARRGMMSDSFRSLPKGAYKRFHRLKRAEEENR